MPYPPLPAMFPRLSPAALAALLALLAQPALAEWRPVTFTNPELRAKGVITGDGAQWFRALAVDRTSGDFMLWCTDVGGLFRSLDGGKNWEPANIGFHSRGSAAAAIDPRNPARAIVVAANSGVHRFNGVYLTTDGAASWREVLPVTQSGSQDRARRSLVYDPSTYDERLGFTRVAYWSRLAPDRPMFGAPPEPHRALYKTEDGGETWAEVPGGEAAASAQLAVLPGSGVLLAAGEAGVLRSTDGGRTWTTTLEGPATGIDTTPAAPELVWATRPDSVWRSTDGGLTWQRNSAADALVREKGVFRNITVAPSDPRRLVFFQWNPGYWHESRIERGFTLIPSNAREAQFAFHPLDADILLSSGGDYPALSRDGGRSYAFAGNGVNNLLVGGSFNFSATDPDVLFLGSQDYGAMLTTDGGESWRYFAPGGKEWGGFNYAAYASTPGQLVVGEAAGWGAPKIVNVSQDGGRGWDLTKLTMATPLVSNGDPRSARTLFASQHRSTDGGRTWTVMNGATHVFTHDTRNGELVGVDQGGGAVRIVRSRDGGASWTAVFTAEGGVTDLAYDPARDRYLVVEQNRLRVWQGGAYLPDPALPHDQTGAPRVRSVALDPRDPAVIYVAANRDTFASSAGALRSRDAGATWENLNLTRPLDGTRLDGGREPQWVRLHPRTREAWFATACYGVWKHSAPE